MAVYTEVSFEDADTLGRTLGLGKLLAIEGCNGGIENTNYFIDTEAGRYVLTVFERLGFEQLPFYLALMKHLAARGIPVPDPAQDAAGVYLHALHGKPAAIVNRLSGASVLAPDISHCEAAGAMLARMHLAAADFRCSQPNLRGLTWWNDTVPLVLPHLDTDQRNLIQGELAYQNHIAASARYTALPRGAIHADLFPDNAFFVGERLSGVIDFYFACTDFLAYDLAVCLNAWCFEGAHYDLERGRAMVAAYEAVRPFDTTEHDALPTLARGAALRFFATRLADWKAVPDGATVTPKDPMEYADKLAFHRDARGAADYGC